MFPRASLIRFLLLLTFCSTLFLLYIYIRNRPSYTLYDELNTQELIESERLAKTGRKKYVMFKQLRGAGFNNQVQDILLYHNLALETSRTYVYQPFVWRPRGEESYVPLSAFLPGATKDSISSEVFERMCPEKEIVHMTLGVPHEDQWKHAVEVLKSDERCVIVDDWIFNWGFLGSSGLHPVWPSFRNYLQNDFQWSSAILDLVHRTQTRLNLRQNPMSTPGDAYIALHLRRGDFESHCEYLSEQKMGFTTWATLPELQSSILSPSLDPSNATSIISHCYPSLRRILLAISAQARLHPKTRTLYVLHDGAIDHPGVYLQFYQLREAVMNVEWAKKSHWRGGPMKRVLQSSDADKVRMWGENDYAVAVDVELARRAEGFVGNGYSSLSTQIAALRLADGGKAEDVTFV
ncbi:hypothetical protein AN958_03484 [Leucoagaricus sp. SymC.cos]|nr:hypothetical protein AN958_03484 [Leucoagaricus sp. SymC.cos]